MVKKLIVLGVALAMLFSAFALTGCEKEDEMAGAFFTLQEAYDNGWLTVENLESIASFPDDDPKQLNSEVATAIKKARAKTIRTRNSNPISGATTDDVTIIGYYGTYNECIAVRLNDSFTDYPDLEKQMVVVGITFVYSGASIVIWKQN